MTRTLPSLSTRLAAAFRLSLSLLLLAGVATGCNDRTTNGKRYTCDCPFLTDMDDPSVQRVRVCAATAVEQVAIGCAQSAAPAPIESCKCELETTPCAAVNECIALER